MHFKTALSKTHFKVSPSKKAFQKTHFKIAPSKNAYSKLLSKRCFFINASIKAVKRKTDIKIIRLLIKMKLYYFYVFQQILLIV